jgi:hypothetical protein
VASDAEREVMGLVLTTNAELVSGVLRGAGAGQEGSVMAAIAATRSLDLIVDDILHALVRQARSDGHTWAEVGEVLQVTRQAAFQRFGAGIVEGAPEEGVTTAIAGAQEKAVALLEDWLNERWDDVRNTFDERMKQQVPAELLASVRAQAAQVGGEFVELGAPAVTVQVGYTVVNVPIAFAKDDATGRVAFNADGVVAGFFILPSESA